MLSPHPVLTKIGIYSHLNSFKSSRWEPEITVSLTSQNRWQYIGSCLALLVINKPEVVSTSFFTFLYCWYVEIGILLLDFHTWHHSVEPIKAAPSFFLFLFKLLHHCGCLLPVPEFNCYFWSVPHAEFPSLLKFEVPTLCLLLV